MLGDSFQARHASVIQSAARPLSIFLTHMHKCTTGFCVWLRMGLWGWLHAAVSLIILYKGNAFVTLFDKNDVFFWRFWWFDELKYVLRNFIKHTIYQNNLGEVHMLLPNWNSCYLNKRTMEMKFLWLWLNGNSNNLQNHVWRLLQILLLLLFRKKSTYLQHKSIIYSLLFPFNSIIIILWTDLWPS